MDAGIPLHQSTSSVPAITAFTEKMEKLRSEKDILLLNPNCADDAGIKALQFEITAFEASLCKLDEQEERYSVELVAAVVSGQQLPAAHDEPKKVHSQPEQSAEMRMRKHYGGQHSPQ